MSAIIFDFDGTIADSFDYVTDFLRHQAKLKELDPMTRQALKHHSMAAMAKQLGFRWWRMPGLFFAGRKHMAERVERVPPFEGMPEVIRKLHAEGHELFLLSTNSLRTLHAFLHKQRMHEYFLELYGGVGLFGKAPAMRRLLRDQKLDAADAWYIGDEPRDIDAANAVGIRSVAVDWGFATPEDLRAARPGAIARKPADILRILER